MTETDRVIQPLIDKEVVLALGAGHLELDGDLTLRPISNNSVTYPGAEYGYMNDHLQLGYQSAIVSMKNPTYGRIGLSAVQRPGSTVSCTQAEALARETERRIGRCPRRRTDLLGQRIQALLSQRENLAANVVQAKARLEKKQEALKAIQQQLVETEQTFQERQAEYQRRQRPERPHSKLAKARKQVVVYQRRRERHQAAVTKAEKWLRQQQNRLSQCEKQVTCLQSRLEQFQEDNCRNVAPVVAVFCLDAGLGTAENIALLIELGYEVYTKPHGNWLSGVLREECRPGDLGKSGQECRNGRLATGGDRRLSLSLGLGL